MREVHKVVNKLTNVEFLEPNKHLVQYAEKDENYVVHYKEVDKQEDEKFTEEGLKCMSMKDLQNICDSLEIEADKRKKDAMIDAILKYRR